MAGGRAIICAIDNGEGSTDAARAAAWLAREAATSLVLAHVFDPMAIPAHPPGAPARLAVADEDLEQAARDRARHLLEAAARAITAVEPATELLEGQPVPELQRLAERRSAALLVTGTAARGGLDRILIGSVASELAARS